MERATAADVGLMRRCQMCGFARMKTVLVMMVKHVNVGAGDSCTWRPRSCRRKECRGKRCISEAPDETDMSNSLDLADIICERLKTGWIEGAYLVFGR